MTNSPKITKADRVFYTSTANGSYWTTSEDTARKWHLENKKVHVTPTAWEPWAPPIPNTPEELFAAVQQEMASLRAEITRLNEADPAPRKKSNSRKAKTKAGYGKKLLDNEKLFEEYFGSVKEALELMYEEGEPFTIRDVEELSPHAQPKSWSALKLSNTSWFKERFEDTGRKTVPERGNSFGRTIYVARKEGSK